MYDNILFYVNLLKQRKDKVKYINKLRKKHPYIKIFPSVYWKNKLKIMNIFKRNKLRISKKKYKFKSDKIKLRNWVISELAIWATYINAYTRLLQTNKKYKYFVLFEDDVILKKNFMYLLYKNYIKNNYVYKEGAVRLGRNLVGSIYTRDQIKNILNFIKKYGIFKAIDDQLIEHNFLKKYTIKLVNYSKKIKSERLKTQKLKKFIKF